MNCGLCGNPQCISIGSDSRRSYVQCRRCQLITVPREQWLSPEMEKQRYSLHDNTIANEGYRRFLDEIVDVIAALKTPSARILDFGSGENKVISTLLGNRGFRCTSYDPLYSIGMDVLKTRYDSLVLCEVIEHLREIKQEVDRLGGLVQRNGNIVIRTQLYPSSNSFFTWWYIQDLTHINFFSESTLEYIAQSIGMSCRKVPEHKDIFVFSFEGQAMDNFIDEMAH